LTNSKEKKRVSGTFGSFFSARCMELNPVRWYELQAVAKEDLLTKRSTEGASPRKDSTWSLTAVSFPYQWVRIKGRGQGIVRTVIPLAFASELTGKTSVDLVVQVGAVDYESRSFSFYCQTTDSIPCTLDPATPHSATVSP
jgi:hypothetical protein